MPLKKMTDDDLQNVVSTACEEAISFIESEIAPDRIIADKYLKGGVDIGHEEGRSKVVATKCRDKVRQVKPSLLRVFMQSGKPVEFVPKGAEDVMSAEQATAFACYTFEQQNGYRLLGEMIHDALSKKVGIAKVYVEEAEDVKTVDVANVPTDDFIVLASPDNVEVVEHSEADGFHDAKLSITKKTMKKRLKSIPPEDFFVDANATSIEDCRVCGHKTEMVVGDVAAMGFDFETVLAMAGKKDDDGGEEESRKGYAETDEGQALDPAMMPIMVTEAFMRVDLEGTGKPQLYAFILGGEKMEVLSKEPVTDNDYAVFEIDPEPHQFFGNDLVGIVKNDQDAATAMLRGVLDNVAMTNNPRIAVNKRTVNMDDVLNNEIGAILRNDGSPGQDIMPMVVPFAAGSTLPALQYFDQVIDDKTGVSRASLGLDPDALQNTTATAVNATVNGGNGQVEAMARNLAEGGLKRLFRLLLRLIVDNPPEEQAMRVNGEFVPFDVSRWDPEMDMTIHVGLGTGQQDMKIAALQMTLQNQMSIWQSYGPGNGLVTMTGIRNTLADLNELAGVHNSDRYYSPMSPQREQQMLMEAQQAQQGQQGADPNAAFLQAEQIKAQQRESEAQMKAQVDLQKAAADNDIKRDQMLQDGVIKTADLVGKYGVGPDLLALYQQQAQN